MLDCKKYRMDVPNRLAQPEKRKDKISKHDMRYMYKMQKGKSKAAKRVQIDQEIKEEAKSSEKRARFSTGKSVRKMNAANIRMTRESAATRKKKLSPEMQLLQKAQAVCSGEIPIPCVLLDNAAQTEEVALTEQEIRAQDAGAIVWNEWDYPNIIPHARLWIFCSKCHLGMPSTAVRHFVPSPSRPQKNTNTETIDSCPIHRWIIFHTHCK